MNNELSERKRDDMKRFGHKNHMAAAVRGGGGGGSASETMM